MVISPMRGDFWDTLCLSKMINIQKKNNNKKKYILMLMYKYKEAPYSSVLINFLRVKRNVPSSNIQKLVKLSCLVLPPRIPYTFHWNSAAK